MLIVILHVIAVLVHSLEIAPPVAYLNPYYLIVIALVRVQKIVFKNLHQVVIAKLVVVLAFMMKILRKLFVLRVVWNKIIFY